MKKKSNWQDIFADENDEKIVSKKKSKTNKRKSSTGKMILIISICVFLIIVVVATLYLNKKGFFKKILDKTPPQLTVKDVTCFCNEQLKVEDFVVEVKDESETRVVFLNEPDTTQPGEQIITIIATDIADHVTQKDAKLTVIKDDSPPEIWCDPNMKISKGSKVRYKTFLAVRDDYDSEPKIEVDNSEVNLEEVGKYPVRYTVTDKAGNVSTLEVILEVVDSRGEDISDEEVDALLNTVIEKIITPDMDKLGQVWAIYDYVRNIPYTYDPYTYDPRYEGYKILHENKGNCYGTYAASALLLTKLGIKNIPVETDGTRGRHFWNMVSLDDGKTWYHFDACQWPEWRPRPVMCMISNQALDEISDAHLGTFHRDKSKYPETPAESMPVPDYVQEKIGADY